MKELKLLDTDLVALVDDDIFELVKDREWHCRHTYVQCGRTMLHHVVLPKHEGMDVDHINGNNLDNQRANLRYATHAQNSMNRGAMCDNSSGYKGVSWMPSIKRWRARIKVNYTEYHIGVFLTKEEAAKAYDRAAKDAYEEFAKLNLPSQLVPKGTYDNRLNSNNKSGFRGVSWCKVMKKWVSRVKIDYVTVRIGYFDDKTEAAHAYDSFVREKLGDKAKLNFPGAVCTDWAASEKSKIQSL